MSIERWSHFLAAALCRATDRIIFSPAESTNCTKEISISDLDLLFYSGA